MLEARSTKLSPMGQERVLPASLSPALRRLDADPLPPVSAESGWLRLVLASLDALECVVVHELCHLRVPDDSRRFWGLVERHRPHWWDQRDWLRRHGPELLALSPFE